MTQPSFTPAELRTLVERFYERARQDAMIGPVFESTVHDWGAHYDMLTSFWGMVMNGPQPGVAPFKGQPLPKHMALSLRPAMFDRWLDIWAAVTGELFEAQRAQVLREKAWRIGQSFQATQAMAEGLRSGGKQGS